MNNKNRNLTAWLVGSIVVLVAAYGLGMVIRQIREWRTEVESQPLDKPATKQGEQKTQPVSTPVKVAEEQIFESSEPTEEMQPQAKEIAAKDDKQASKETPASEPMQERPQMSGRMGNFWQMWADLNLTEEEKARLQEGFRLARERWQNMSEEERQAEMDRMRAMRERWENMSDEERQAAMERGRQRFEEWRRSGQVELPPMTLD